MVFPRKGFPCKPLCLLVILYLSCHTCWLVHILLAIGAILFMFMVYGWFWHMMHTWFLWYVDDEDWCVSEFTFSSIFLIGKFGQHRVWRIDTMCPSVVNISIAKWRLNNSCYLLNGSCVWANCGCLWYFSLVVMSNFRGWIRQNWRWFSGQTNWTCSIA